MKINYVAKKIKRYKINLAFQNKFSVAKYPKRCKINMIIDKALQKNKALQNKYEIKFCVAK
jgi:hypothetical protein